MPFRQKERVNTSATVKFQERPYHPSKYHVMIDPPLATAPMGINLDKDKCNGCGNCIPQCPSQILKLVKRDEVSALQSPACQFNCPAGIEVREYVKLIADGASLDKAWSILTRMNPFPGVTGRVCPHPCESACNRTYLDASLNINCIERSVGDYGIDKGLSFNKPAKLKDEKVAVVGAGPSGLSCAYQLALMGYQVTVFEASEKAGGMLTYAIPSYRLPEAVVQKEIKRITDLGVTLKLNTAVGKDITIDELKKQFKAVYVAVGAQGSTALGIQGEATNVLTGLSFLRSVKEKKPAAIGKKVVVIGGGNTAIDAARTARRLGSDVTLLYRRTAAQMPAYAAEVEAAKEEGVQMQFLCAPVKSDGQGGVLTCQKMQLGEADASGRPRPVPVSGSDFNINFNTLIAAVGQDLQAAGIEGLVGQSGWIAADGLGQTADKSVFAGGDAAKGPGLVSEAIGAGRKAALGIDAFIRGVKLEIPEKREIAFPGAPLDQLHNLKNCRDIKRNEARKLDAGKRLADANVEERIPLSADQVVTESKRCMECGKYVIEYATQQVPYFGKICLACQDCYAICPQKAIMMKTFWRIDEGRWATALNTPVDVEDGLPNPLGLPRPVPFEEIESRITPVEKVIYTRRSVRRFKKDPVPREMIERVLEAARFAPTAGNCLGVKFVVLTDQGIMKEIGEDTAKFLAPFPKIYAMKGIVGSLLKKILCLIYPNLMDMRPIQAVNGLFKPQFGDGYLDVFFEAPVAIMVIPHDLHISEPQIGMGIACQNMVLAAHSLGLGTCYVGLAVGMLNKDKKGKIKWRKRLGLEWPYEKTSMILLMGYPAVRTDGPVPRDFPLVAWK